MKLYGITPELKAEALRAQGNCCHACGATDPGPQGWHTDHDHETGEFRAVLCGYCNLTIGNAKENVARLLGCAAYITDYKTSVLVEIL